ncbi:integrase core domain-containing protein [Ditylenchus destructor]|uniref:Integrase core domain-containing protein n=1 Tax=Ditylenchus destructor TaxID=166010 RepID=A0AAD4NI99_9BILA|nr:integrase core domain-containing protein [Ditylenchus destructor]
MSASAKRRQKLRKALSEDKKNEVRMKDAENKQEKRSLNSMVSRDSLEESSINRKQPDNDLTTEQVKEKNRQRMQIKGETDAEYRRKEREKVAQSNRQVRENFPFRQIVEDLQNREVNHINKYVNSQINAAGDKKIQRVNLKKYKKQFKKRQKRGINRIEKVLKAIEDRDPVAKVLHHESRDIFFFIALVQGGSDWAQERKVVVLDLLHNTKMPEPRDNNKFYVFHDMIKHFRKEYYTLHHEKYPTPTKMGPEDFKPWAVYDELKDKYENEVERDVIQTIRDFFERRMDVKNISRIELIRTGEPMMYYDVSILFKSKKGARIGFKKSYGKWNCDNSGMMYPFPVATVPEPLATKTAAEVARNLIKIFATFGAPKILHSDNGREFANKVVSEVVRQWPICRIVHGKPRHSQSQGSVERANRDIGDILIMNLRQNKSTAWAAALPQVQAAKNSRFHRGIGRSPYEAIFGHKMKLGYEDEPVIEEVDEGGEDPEGTEFITLDGSKWIEKAENDEPLETSNSPSPARSRSQSPARSSPSSQASDSITRLKQMSQGTWKDVSFEEEEYGAVLDEEDQLNRLHFLREQEREGARKQQKRQAEQMLQESAKRWRSRT